MTKDYAKRRNQIYLNWERKKLTYQQFTNDIIPITEVPYSFFRSDFRGSEFKDVTLLNSIFDRADFIETSFQKVQFKSIYFGNCEVKNCNYKHCTIENSKFKGAVFMNSIFYDCEFINIVFRCSTDRTKFIDCKFSNCIFNRSSLEETSFINCTIENTNLAECHAENLIFNATRLKDVYIGAPFIPTYLIRNTNIFDAKLKYRGYIISFKEYINKFEDKLLEEQRYFELLNISIIIKKVFEYEYFVTYFQKAFNLNEQKRKYTITNILKMIDFYFSYNIIDFVTYLKIIDYLNNIFWDKIGFEESLEYRAILFTINEKINNFCYDCNYLVSINEKINCKFNIRLNYTDEQEAKTHFLSLFKKIEELTNSAPSELKIEKVEKGSVILYILGSLRVITLVAYLFKLYRREKIMEKLKLEIYEKGAQKYKELLDKASKPQEVKKIMDMAEYIGFDTTEDTLKKIKRLKTELIISEIISLAISIFF